MTKPNSQARAIKPAIALYCVSDGRARAAVFKGPDVEPALKAAQLLKFSVLQSESDEARRLYRDLPVGQIGAKGQNIAPFVRKDLLERLTSLVERENGGAAPVGAGAKIEPLTAREKQKAGQPRLPADWADIKVGDLVLVQDKDPTCGWWEAIVAEIAGDMVKLRWPDEPRGRPVQRHRLALGLMFAGDPAKPLPSAPTAPNNGKGSVYPHNWTELGVGRTVLAKEEGPMQQWWEAKISSEQGELFTLDWLNFDDLPPINRPRLELALVHPSPKSR